MYLWDYLKTANRPVVLYGTGNGGDKIFSCCEEYGITVSGVFASDDHQSGAVFHGFHVTTLAEIAKQYQNPIILLAFGTEREELIEKIRCISHSFEILAPDTPLCGGPIFTPKYVESIRNTINDAKKLLSDEKSLMVFDGLMDFKETGKITSLFSIETASCEKRELIQLGDNEAFLDLGAFTGDTIDEFLDWTAGNYDEIIAFEPDERNFKKLSLYAENLKNTEIHPFATWKEDAELTFTGKGGRNCGIATDVPGKKPHLHTVSAKTVDSLHKRITFAKLDVEGAEAETLAGMRDTINRFHPSMQISVYHKTDDFITIPLLLESICPGYNMYLRHHPSLPAWELQLYCVFPE